VAVGFYFLYLAKRENSKHLKIGGYILVIMGLLITLTTAGVAVKKMTCKKHQCMRHHHGEGHGGEMGQVQCLDDEKHEKVEKEEKDD
jgi:hypothetical protein